jgi:hypothetical protein
MEEEDVTLVDEEDDTCVEDPTPAEEELEDVVEEVVDAIEVVDLAEVGATAIKYTPPAATTMTMTMIAVIMVLNALPFLTSELVRMLKFPREISGNIFLCRLYNSC